MKSSLSTIRRVYRKARRIENRNITPRCNVDENRKLVFVHNPKCAGTSARKALGFSIDTADHRYPAAYLRKNEWESYYVIVVVREPISRLLSAYRFHCRSDYSGPYIKKFPNLKEMEFCEYLDLAKSGQVAGLGPQVGFAVYPGSAKQPNALLLFENLDWSKIPERFFVSKLKNLNTAEERKVKKGTIKMSDTTFKEMIKFCEEDYDYFKEIYRAPSPGDLLKFECKVD